MAFLNLPSKIRTRPETILLYIWHLKADTLTDSAGFLGLIKLLKVLSSSIIPAPGWQFSESPGRRDFAS